MENHKLLALTVWTVVGSYVAFLMMCTATFTNNWIYTREILKITNGTGVFSRDTRQHSGLLVTCQLEDKIHWNPHEGENSSWDVPLSDNECKKLKKVLEDDDNPPDTITFAVFVHTSKSFPVPLMTCFLLLTAVIVCTVGQFMPKRRCMVFLSGSICVVCGLTSLTAIVRFVIAVNDAIIEKDSNDVNFQHHYGFSFVLTVLTFLLTNGVGVASLHLFILLERQAARSEKERVRHHLQRLGMNVVRAEDASVPLNNPEPGNEERYGLPVSSWKETQYGFEGEPNWKDDRAKSEL